MRRLSLFLLVPVWFTLLPCSGYAQAARPTTNDTVEVNGIQLAYRTIGDGDPLLLLHGFGQTGNTWESLFDELATQFRLVVPDLRGHGHSTNPSGQFTHRQAAADIFALLDHLRLSRVKAMGISTGGMTLLHMATSQPDRIEAMVLIGATSYFPQQARAIMRASSPDSMPLEQLQAFSRAHSRGLEQGRQLMRQFHGFKDSYDDMNFTPAFLSTITARTLIVHGDRDRFFPVAIPVEAYRSIPKAYLWIVPNGGHVPLLGTESGARIFAETTLEFLAGRW